MENSLLSFRKNITSENGEDGIIEEIFKIVGEENRWCVELGALDGKGGSNTWSLIKNKGWSAVLIEADKTFFKRLEGEHGRNKKVVCINAFVSFDGPNSLDKIFSKTDLPENFDLLSLDIDGNDYHLWDSLLKYRPRVIVIEFNPSIQNNISFIQPKDMSVFEGSSLKAIVELGKRKGYELVCASGANAFFVQKELFSKFGIKDNSIECLHQDVSFQTQIFQLYDGTLKIAGNDRLIWHKLKIDEEKLQVLPKRKRFYPAKISENDTVRSLKYFLRKLPFYSLIQRARKFLLNL